MPIYLIKRATRLAHSGQLLNPGEVVDIEWPADAEPKKLGDNMVEVNGMAGAQALVDRETAAAAAATKAKTARAPKERKGGSARIVGAVPVLAPGPAVDE